MRVTQQLISQAMLHNVRTSSSKMHHLMAQMANGQRLQRPSDDPVTFEQLGRLEHENTVLAQYRQNITTINSYMRQVENPLNTLVQSTNEAQDLVLQALNGHHSPADVNSLGASLDQLRTHMFNTANTQDSLNNYMFSGTATTTAPLVYDPTQPVGSRYSFAGNTLPRKALVDENTVQSYSVSLNHLPDLLNQMESGGALMRDAQVNPNDPATHTRMNTTLQALKDGLQNLSDQVAQLGNTQKKLEQTDDNFAAMQLTNQEVALKIGAVDYAQAMTELSDYTLTLQSAYKAYGKMTQNTLFDVI